MVEFFEVIDYLEVLNKNLIFYVEVDICSCYKNFFKI